jgi:hypothetical protein
MSTGSVEPSSQSAEFEMMFGQQHGSACAGQNIRSGHAAQSAADHDDIVLVTGVLQGISGHKVEDSGLGTLENGS